MHMRKRLFTIGHSTHSAEYFVSLLRQHGIDAVCDVRSMPRSRFNPQFNAARLKESLRAAGLGYVFLGAELGARSANPACYMAGKVQYRSLAREPAFLEGIARLRTGIAQQRVALMCAEKDPLTCHRTILVCRELRSADLDIAHILADGSLETNEAAEQRLLCLLGVTADLLCGERESIELAYDKQASRIAYVRSGADIPGA